MWHRDSASVPLSVLQKNTIRKPCETTNSEIFVKNIWRIRKNFLPLRCPFWMLKALWDGWPSVSNGLRVIAGGLDTYIQRRFLNALGLTSWESRKFKLIVKDKATGTPLRGVVIATAYPWLYTIFTSAWGFQRCSVGQSGQCESLQDVDRAQNWLHVFRVYAEPETVYGREWSMYRLKEFFRGKGNW